MYMVGIKELKNRLTYYLRLAKRGDRIVVTQRGAPIAVLHSLDQVEDSAGLEEKLASLAKRGALRLPLKPDELASFDAVTSTGKPASQSIIEARR